MGWFEHQLIVILREMLKLTGPQGLMAFGKTGLTGKIGALLALSEHIFGDSPLSDDLRAMAKEIQEFEKIWNAVVHGLWVHDKGDPQALALLRRENGHEKVRPRPDRDAYQGLAGNISDLRQIQNEAQRLTKAIKDLKGNFKPTGK